MLEFLTVSPDTEQLRFFRLQGDELTCKLHEPLIAMPESRTKTQKVALQIKTISRICRTGVSEPERANHPDRGVAVISVRVSHPDRTVADGFFERVKVGQKLIFTLFAAQFVEPAVEISVRRDFMLLVDLGYLLDIEFCQVTIASFRAPGHARLTLVDKSS